MIIMQDTHQPSPIERFLTWYVAYTNYQSGLENLRNSPPLSAKKNCLNSNKKDKEKCQ